MIGICLLGRFWMFYGAAVYKLGCKRLIDSNGFSYSIGVSGEESAIKEQKANQIKTFRAYGFERLLPEHLPPVWICIHHPVPFPLAGQTHAYYNPPKLS